VNKINSPQHFPAITFRFTNFPFSLPKAKPFIESYAKEIVAILLKVETIFTSNDAEAGSREESLSEIKYLCV